MGERLSSLDYTRFPEELLAKLGGKDNLHFTGNAHDPLTISRSNVLFFETISPIEKLALKIYSKDGHPENELTAYDILNNNRQEFPWFPKTYADGFLSDQSKYLLMCRVEGKKLSDTISTSQNSQVDEFYFRLVSDRILSLRKIPHPDNLSSLIKDGWLRDDTSGLKDFIYKGYRHFGKNLAYLLKNDKSKEKTLSYAIGKVESLAPPSIVFCHGDMLAQNVFINGARPDQIEAFIDWEYSFYGPREKDQADLIATFSFNSMGLSLDRMVEISAGYGYDMNILSNLLNLRTFIQASVAFTNNSDDEVQKYFAQMRQINSYL